MAQSSDFEISFESTRTITQDHFAEWVHAREGWDPHHYELMLGRIVMNPPAGYPHGAIENRVEFLITLFVRAHKLGQVFGSSQGFELPTGDTLEPDVSFVSNERWQNAPSPEVGKFLKVVPDLVVEILSASTASRDRGEKKSIYERAGVREYWLVDWRARELLRFNLVANAFGRETVYGEQDRISSVVLQGLEFAVIEAFP